MIKATIVFALILFSFPLYSQNVERREENGVIYEVIEDTAAFSTASKKSSNEVIFVFLGDFYRNKIKIKMDGQVLVNTILSTRNDKQGISDSDNCVYIPKVTVKNCCSKNIDFILNKKKYRFPFKSGYSILYFSFYGEKGTDGSNRMVYSLTYTNKFLIRL
jgi:hypothetical protein